MEKLSVIKAMIISRDKTITQVAKENSLNQSHISQVIQYKKNISQNHLLKLLDCLGYTYEQYQYLENYRTKLEKTEIDYSKKWTLLLIQTTMFFLENCALKQNETQTQNCIGGK